MSTNFNAEKRRTLKIITGTCIVGTGLTSFTNVLADSSKENPVQSDFQLTLSARLISRADVSRAHLLIHNSSEHAVQLNAFASQVISYDLTLLNLAAAFKSPATIPAKDRVMLRLDVAAGIDNVGSISCVLDMNRATSYLPQGTRVVDLTLHVAATTARISAEPVLV